MPFVRLVNMGCFECGGGGYIGCSFCDGIGAIQKAQDWEFCWHCEGTGRMLCDCIRPKPHCWKCQGTGRMLCSCHTSGVPFLDAWSRGQPCDHDIAETCASVVDKCARNGESCGEDAELSCGHGSVESGDWLGDCWQYSDEAHSQDCDENVRKPCDHDFSVGCICPVKGWEVPGYR